MKKFVLMLLIIGTLGFMVACDPEETPPEENPNQKVQDVIEQVMIPEEVTGTKITLNTKLSDVTITWESDKPEIIDILGNVNRPFMKDEEVILTATFSYKEVNSKKNYPVLVKGIYELEDVSVTLTNLEYSITQEIIEEKEIVMEVNAVVTIKGDAFLMDESALKDVKLVMYWQDDTELATYENELDSTDGSFEFKVYPSKFSIGGDWYKFKLVYTEGEIVRNNVALPFLGEFKDEKALAVRQGKDGEIKYLQFVENNQTLNANFTDSKEEEKTDRFRVLADYGRVFLNSTELINGSTLIKAPIAWGSGSEVSWSADNEYILINELEDRFEIEVLKDTAADQTIYLTATITYGDESVDKVFKVTTHSKVLTFSDAKATYESRVVDGKTFADIKVVGTYDNPLEQEFTLKMEAYINDEANPTRLAIFENSATEDGKYEFLINASEITVDDGEWVKLRLVVIEGEDEKTFGYATGTIEIPEGQGVYDVLESEKAINLGNEWDIFYFKHGDVITFTIEIEEVNVSIEVESDDIFLVIKGFVFENQLPEEFREMKLRIKNVGDWIENTTTETNDEHFEFKFDLSQISDEYATDWLDLNLIIIIEGFDDVVLNFEFDETAVSALNEAEEEIHAGRKYYFAEWASDLKIVFSIE